MTKTRAGFGVSGVMLGAWIAIAGVMNASGGEPAREDFVSFRQKELGELETELASISADAANAPLIEAAKNVVKDVDAIVAEVTDRLDRARSTAISGMLGDAVGASTEKPPTTVTAGSAEQVRDVYLKNHDRVANAVAAASADTPEARAVRQYIDVVMSAAQEFIFLRGQELDALGEAGTAGAEWATLMPLLRYEDASWNERLVSDMPEWMRETQSLRAAEYVCLCSGRPKAAYHLWVYQISLEQEATPRLENYLAYLHRSANACFGSRDLAKGVTILKAAVTLGDSEGMIDEAIKARFRLAEAFKTYGHLQLAADEMKLVTTAYPRHKDCGRAAVTRLVYLYEAGMFDKAVGEAKTYLEDEAIEAYRPQILYVAWAANRSQDKQAAADDIRDRLLRDYPDHPLCADLYFTTALKQIIDGDYAGASRLLDMIVERYPKTKMAEKAKSVRSQLPDIGR